jgi:hypothetical protein
VENSIDLASLILGLISVGLIFVYGAGVFFGPVAIILGIIGCGKDESRRLSIIGIILGIIGFLFSLYFFSLFKALNYLFSIFY